MLGGDGVMVFQACSGIQAVYSHFSRFWCVRLLPVFAYRESSRTLSALGSEELFPRFLSSREFIFLLKKGLFTSEFLGPPSGTHIRLLLEVLAPEMESGHSYWS